MNIFCYFNSLLFITPQIYFIYSTPFNIFSTISFHSSKKTKHLFKYSNHRIKFTINPASLQKTGRVLISLYFQSFFRTSKCFFSINQNAWRYLRTLQGFPITKFALIRISPHYQCSNWLHSYIISSSHHQISTSSHYHIISSSYQLIITSSHHHINFFPFPLPSMLFHHW